MAYGCSGGDWCSVYKKIKPYAYVDVKFKKKTVFE